MSDNYRQKEDIMTVWQWVGVIIVLGIPVVNIIMYFVWAFSENTNENLSNFCKATLLIALIGIAFAMLVGGCSAMLY